MNRKTVLFDFRKILIFFSCLCLTTYSSTAQLPFPKDFRLTTFNGLPHNTIIGVEQDKAGFIWIATLDGLARYDGRNVKVFRNRPGDLLSLADNKIMEMIPAPDGTFIIQTESNTIQKFDPITERFTTLLSREFLDRNNALVNQVQISADGRHLWGLLPGVRIIDYDIQQKSLRSYDVTALTGGVNNLHDFILAPTGHIYGETMAGLLQFDTKTGRKRIIPYPFTTVDRVRDMSYWSINRHQVMLGPEGQIVVFGYDVLALYDPVNETFRTITIPDVVKPSTKNARKLSIVIAYSLKKQIDKQLYFGYMNRLYRLDKKNDRLTLIRQSEFPGNKLVPWLIDRSGAFWISDGPNGLTRLELHPWQFGYIKKNKSFSEDLLEQDLKVTVPDSFAVWDTEHWPRYFKNGNSAGYLIDPMRVYRHTTVSRNLEELTGFGKLNNQTCCNLAMKTDRQAEVWVYNNIFGLISAKSDETGGTVYPHSQLPLTNLNASYDVGDIQPMGQSVWVGSQYGLGLFRYDIIRKRFDSPLRNQPHQPNSLSDNTINCLHADPSDTATLWIGTAGGGLCELNTRTMTFRRLSEAEGFPSNIIQSIETDRQNMLWCATSRGLVRLNPRKLTWTHFTEADGLEESSFMLASSARLPDDRLVFGTTNGRVIFDPAAIYEKKYQPPLVLTSLLINNKLVDVADPNSPFSSPINILPELVLDHTQNFLTLSFAGLDFTRADKLMYRYKLSDVDSDWVTVGTQNTANYTQLKPGRYVFSVNCTTADGQWSNQVRHLMIVLRPPFWATWFAYLFYTIAVGGMVFGFIYLRIRQAEQRKDAELKFQEAKQLRALDEIKNRFFSNITHEFRTPLTLILSPTEILLGEDKHDVSTRSILQSVRHNALQLLDLINQLLDLSKLENSHMSISLVQGDAIGFIESLAEKMRPMAENRKVTLRIQTVNATTRSSSIWMFDADKYSKIVVNLLSNAFKFTPSGGVVSLKIEQHLSADSHAGQLVLHVIDTGIGIAPQDLTHIFDRFYQADDSHTRAFEGTGIGLALVKELTHLLGGSITVSSRTEAPSGTTFTLILPLILPDADQDIPGLNPAMVTDTLLSGTETSLEEIFTTPSEVANESLVLVVEDNEELRAFIASQLSSRYKVLTAADGEEGWEVCERELPDLVISDVMMQRRDGYQLLQIIKTTLATNHIPVILLTARSAYESRITGLEFGADDYLTKPFQFGELLLRMENMLTRQANLRARIQRELSSPETTNEERPVDSFLQQLHRIVEANMTDSAFGVDTLAQAVSMSRRTLNRKLASTSGLSPSDVIRFFRINKAAQMLKEGKSVSETAYAVGFESPAYFATVFKQIYKQTPSEFSAK